MNSRIIKVLLVDDSPVALKILGRILSAAPDLHIVGTARNGREGLKLIPELQPDVVCTDLHMPVMEGLEFVKRVMAEYPRPILVVSVSVQEGSQNIFKLLDEGALDVFAKPRSGIKSDYEKKALELISKVRMLSGVKVFRRPGLLPHSEKEGAAGAPISVDGERAVQIIAIGASTGGPQTLERVLSGLPANFPVPLICIQHIGDEFLAGFIEWLASLCRMRIRIAAAGEMPEAGTIYFPRAGQHLEVDGSGQFVYNDGPPYDGHRPSITLMMKSLAGVYKKSVLSVLLTGMGRDGAEGMEAVSRAGGITIAQDEESSIVYGMPKAAIELGAAKYVLSAAQIADVLKTWVIDGQFRVRGRT